jgi:hypothetical protein
LGFFDGYDTTTSAALGFGTYVMFATPTVEESSSPSSATK